MLNPHSKIKLRYNGSYKIEEYQSIGALYSSLYEKVAPYVEKKD